MHIEVLGDVIKKEIAHEYVTVYELNDAILVSYLCAKISRAFPQGGRDTSSYYVKSTWYIRFSG